MNDDQGSFECLVARSVVFPVISEGMGQFIHYSAERPASVDVAAIRTA
jgi:hypothetical protein